MQPTRYVPNADYSVDLEPGDTGNALDADFVDIQTTTDAICDNLELLQRDDGGLKNGIVTPDSLSASAAAMLGDWTPRGAWVTATAYSQLDFVTQSGIGYLCLVDHVAGTFATDLAAGKWTAISKVDSLATAFALTLLDDASASAMLTTLGVSTFIKTLLDDADAATARTTLGAQSSAQVVSAIATALAAQYAAKGDQVFGTGAGAQATKTVGAAGTIPMARPASAYGVADVAALGKAIYGFTYANNVADATNDIDVAAGGAMDATGAYWITGAALTKRLDAAWAVGNAQGGLDTGSIGNSDYYLWAIARSDTGVVDYLFSLSSTAPTMPANYDFKRLIGWFKRVSNAISAFTTYETAGGGLDFLWNAVTSELELVTTLTSTRRTDAMRVPLNFSTEANINILVKDTNVGVDVYVYCPDQSDQTPNGAGSLAVQPTIRTQVANVYASANLRVRTDATGKIAAKADETVDSYYVSTIGFTWSRRV